MFTKRIRRFLSFSFAVLVTFTVVTISIPQTLLVKAQGGDCWCTETWYNEFLAYFDQTVPPAPQYLDRSGNGIIDIFDYSLFVECVSKHGGYCPVGSFNPGDGRIDPRPGDRVAVYCDSSDRITIYGIGSNSEGFLLSEFSFKQVFNEGILGISVNKGSDGNVLLRVDKSGNFIVRWSGGRFQATGEGDFAKSFACSFPLPSARSGFTWISKARFDELVATYFDSEVKWARALAIQTEANSLLSQIGRQAAEQLLFKCIEKGVETFMGKGIAIGVIKDAAKNFAFGSAADTERNLQRFNARRTALQTWEIMPGYRYSDFVQVPIDLAGDVPLVDFPLFFVDWSLYVEIPFVSCG